MFIDPEKAKARLNDPSNIVNRLLDIGLGPLPKGNSSPSKDIPSSAPASDEEVSPSSEALESVAELAQAEAGTELGLAPLPLEQAGPKARIRLGRNRTSVSVEAGESKVVNGNRHGRTKGATELNPLEREIIGTLTRIDGPASVSRAFEVAPSTAFQAGQGNSKKDEGLSDRVKRNLDRVRDVALDRLLSSVNLMEDDKMEGLTAKDLSAIAANLSRVVEKTLPKDLNQGPTAQLIVYAPTIAKEEHYETVVLSR